MTTHEHNIDDQILLSKLAQLENEIIQALEQHSQKKRKY